MSSPLKCLNHHTHIRTDDDDVDDLQLSKSIPKLLSFLQAQSDTKKGTFFRKPFAMD